MHSIEMLTRNLIISNLSSLALLDFRIRHIFWRAQLYIGVTGGIFPEDSKDSQASITRLMYKGSLFITVFNVSEKKSLTKSEYLQYGHIGSAVFLQQHSNSPRARTVTHLIATNSSWHCYHRIFY